ncbi:MAG: DegQ family serine endoprotease [Candidatus Thiodiazotropha sp. (ex Lucinoma aequizonata)]|nr:DegQ family serine endoprotease [Candidatus Thiodiazotropha sp. (ex Lucinoma aequizonata)]MCU7887389.1 DegQ family serine endoprotease [Candidatus Thiodiazotropha sp. (ex Lucinoma aequizonata)]MCU7895863.1 DegQ family serine endoprotease [Candidatus Thiodiazotropha sp. (ex Lucinoma aequizonata)]MCU7900159.1 DegQ family serine endoprotease [Candidatus Thiodiazotropha sp. (ex Lucinoma aequizonata)]MCU7904149.1 DegQ family serine endoprotease [Candidatus Thiodiazotropha sp. (ex Lucinoma aequizo
MQIFTTIILGLIFSLPLQAHGLPDFIDLAEQNAPSVVNISTKQKTLRNNMQPFNIPEFQYLPEGNPLGELMKKFFGNHGSQMPEEGLEKRSLGSGFIISEDGFILTNNHVVDEADQILVRMNDRREFVAEVIGKDEYSDIALIKIDADDLQVVEIGDSEKLKVGEWVLAIGSPFGFDHSVTAGIVSAKGRNLPSENYVPFIQTDVAINPGNSGGPLFNLDGKVVGMNSQIYSRSGGFMGLSFAIPIEMAINIAAQLKTRGRVTRGWLGVLIQDVTNDLADSFAMDYPRGALIARVLPDSPSEKAELQVGDVILEFNGTKIATSSELPPLVGRSNVDKPAVLTILRNGKSKQVKVNVGELPADDKMALANNQVPKVSENRLGLMVSSISEQLRKKLRLTNRKGVLVESVTGQSAREAGIHQDDVITMINNREVESVEQFNQLVKELPTDKTVAILLHRDTGPIFLALHVPEE